MKKLIKVLLIVLFVVAITSCAKEYSFENPLTGTGNVIIGNNCIINRVTEYDTIGRRGASAFNYLFNTNGSALISISQRDSIINTTIFNKTITKNLDTLKIDALQYIVVDTMNGNRVKRFVGYEDPYTNTTPLFVNDFSYNSAGKVVAREVKLPQFPGVVYYRSEYTYTGNNLTSIIGKIPLNNTVFLNITIEFDLTKQPKNYFTILPDCKELKPYIAGLQFGQPNTNIVKKVVMRNYNQLTGVLIDSTVTNFSNYKFSVDNYILSVDASGYDIPALPLASGRNTFGYFCR